MPNQDGTGPYNGDGPMTGGCRGKCKLPTPPPAQEEKK